MAEKGKDAGGGAAGALASAVGAAALWRASRHVSDREPEPAVPATDDPAALAERLSVERPDGGLALLRWRFDRYQRAHPWLGFPLGVVKKFTEDQAGQLAALIAYFGFFSIFPLMLAFISIIGFALEPDDQQRLADEAANQIPVVGTKIISIVESNGEIGGSIVAIVVGIAVALWSGLKMIDAMQNALNGVWDIPPVDRPNIVKKRSRSLLMLAVLGAGIVGSVVVSGLATFVDAIPGIGKVAIWAGSAVVSVLLYWAAFQLLTDRKLEWSALLPGAIFGGIGWWALQTFGTPIVQNAQQNDTFGDFSAIIALMTFFFLAAQISILGAEISAVRTRRIWPRSYVEGDLTVADVEAFRLHASATQLDPAYTVAIVPDPQHRP